MCNTSQERMRSIDLELFKKYYYDERLKLEEIARRFSCCKATILRIIKTNGFKSRERLSLVENLTGRKINKLTFLSYVKNDKFGKALWLCRCDCGKEKILNASAIKAKLTTSCGCFKRRRVRARGVGDLSWTFFKKLKKDAMQRNYEFALDMSFLCELFKKQEQKCAVTGVPISLHPDSNQTRLQTASLDRIDSKRGYVKDNVQWVHKRINRMKNILGMNELLFWSQKIIEHHKATPIKSIDTNLVTWD